MPRLSPRASRRAWPSASARVLDGVVLVDFQVAGAPELERKPAVTRHLLEHVIEERDSGCDTSPAPCDRDRLRPRSWSRASGGRPGPCVAASPAVARSLPRFPRRCPGDGRAARRALGSQRAPGPCRDRRSRSLRYDRSSAPPGNSAAVRSVACGSRNRPPHGAGRRTPHRSGYPGIRAAHAGNPAARGSWLPGTTACRAHPGC